MGLGSKPCLSITMTGGVIMAEISAEEKENYIGRTGRNSVIALKGPARLYQSTWYFDTDYRDCFYLKFTPLFWNFLLISSFWVISISWR